MSRIEKAIEKASKMRTDTPGKTDRATTQKESRSTPRAEPVKVQHSCIVTLNDPKSPVAEEYRKLKSVLVKLTRQEEFKNLIVVTSAVSGEGKSVTATNLAVTLAQEYDNTVLLIDADLRRPSLYSYLNVTPELGLSDCLTDGVDLSAALIRTGIGRLTFLPSGRGVKNPVEILGSHKMREFIIEVKNRYPDRYIVIDAPPVLTFAETLTVSSLSDGVVFVIKEGLASMHDIREALDMLSDSTIFGIVYNEACVEGLNSRYHYHYSHYYTDAPKFGEEVRV